MKRNRKYLLTLIVVVMTLLFMEHIWITDLAMGEWYQSYQLCKMDTGYVGLDSGFTNGFYNWDLIQGYHVAMYEGITAILGLAMVALYAINRCVDEE